MTECCGDAQNQLKGVTDFFKTDFLTEIEHNLKFFFDYTFVQAGAYKLISPSVDGCEGAEYTLKNVVNPNGALANRVFDSIRKDWLYENQAGEVILNDVSILVDGVKLDAADYVINYPMGRVILNTPTTGVVTAEYYYRIVQTYLANYSPWWQELVHNTWSPEKTKWDLRDSITPVFKKNSIQLPAIIIEVDGGTTTEPFQLGSCANFFYPRVSLTVISEDMPMLNKIMAILMLQVDKRFYLFDTDTAEFPLDNCTGARQNTNDYPDIVTSNKWDCVRIVRINNSKKQSPCKDLHFGRVDYTIEILGPSK